MAEQKMKQNVKDAKVKTYMYWMMGLLVVLISIAVLLPVVPADAPIWLGKESITSAGFLCVGHWRKCRFRLSGDLYACAIALFRYDWHDFCCGEFSIALWLVNRAWDECCLSCDS